MLSAAREIQARPSRGEIRFTFATLVTNRTEYAEMLSSLQAKGFGGRDCEFLYLDNSDGNALSAYAGLNRLLNESRGTYVVLCHQDIRLLDDDRSTLEACLTELDDLDPRWALAGNAGGIAPGRLALRITDPHGSNTRRGNFPQRVGSLDENFIVVRRDARLCLSHDLEGFHLYGADLAVNADVLGCSAYVIDFHLHHLSGGTKSASFHTCERAFRAKYARAFRTRLLQTTCTLVPLSGNPATRALLGALGPPLKAVLRRLPESLKARFFGQRQSASARQLTSPTKPHSGAEAGAT